MKYTDHLETPRLTTRFLTQDIVPAWTEFFNDPVATRYNAYMNNGMSAAERARDMVNTQLKRYKDNRLGMQALTVKETGEFIGMCGILVQDINYDRALIEVGYHLLPRFWGNGYATEAAQLFRDYGFENNFADSIVSVIHPENIPSKNVALRNGMQLVETGVVFKGNEYDLFRITREEWELLKKS